MVGHHFSFALVFNMYAWLPISAPETFDEHMPSQNMPHCGSPVVVVVVVVVVTVVFVVVVGFG